MNFLSTALVCALLSWTLPTGEQISGGWIALFDGESLYGWTSENPDLWLIENGTLVGNGGATLRSNARFASAQVSYQIQTAACADWVTKTAVLEGGRFEIQVPAGETWKIRNIFLKPEKMDSLFNGENLDQWNLYPEMAGDFSVDAQEKQILVKNGPGMLETKAAYDNFVLQAAVFTKEKNLNSGIFFRCIPGEKMNGYECQIHNGFKNDDRTQPLDAGTGAIFRRTTARYIPANDQEWFYVTIVADGPRLCTWVNGLQVTEWTDERKPNPNPRRGLRLEAGTIMLQAHDPTTDVMFRELRIQPLD
ncbi:MAG: DUF1080 domain-containing protein [Planctomycetia bacterium]|nr:DUF1080 domain-containing protein [Planctomycetia bacterium]